MSASVPKFDVLLSNPPYQVMAGGKRHQVYAALYEALKHIAHRTAVIVPSGWQWSLGSASGSVEHPAMRADPHIVSVDNFLETDDSPVHVFETVGTGGVSVIQRNIAHDNGGLVSIYEHGEYVEERDLTVVRYWGKRTQRIFDALDTWRTQHTIGTMDSHIAPMLSYGLQSFDARHPEYAAGTSQDGWIPCWGKGHGAGYGWQWIDPAFPKLRIEKPGREIWRWKVVFGVAAGMSTLYRKAFVMAPGEVFTGAFTAVFFDSQAHADNFLSYMRTDLYKFLGAETAASINTTPVNHRFVPDMGSVENPRTGLVGWNSDWFDEDLQQVLQHFLTPDDWQHIVDTAAVANSSAKQRF